MTEVLAIAGSLRRGSWNRRLLDAAASLAPPGMRVRVDDSLAALPLFDEDAEPGPAAVAALRARVAGSQGLVIATPEYNRSIPGGLKNALDWLSRTDALAGKPIAVLGATVGRWGTRLAQAELRRVLEAADALVMPAPALYVRDAAALFDAVGHLTDAATRDGLRELLAAFARWVALVGASAPLAGG